jgi:hypothetical protein
MRTTIVVPSQRELLTLRAIIGDARVLRLRHALEDVVAGHAGDALLVEAVTARRLAGSD